LTPAPRRQDHTTSPSARVTLVIRNFRVHRIPPHVRDDREPPLVRVRRGGLVEMICPTGIADYFASEDWTGQITLEFLGKLVFFGAGLLRRKARGFATARRICLVGEISCHLSRFAAGHALLGHQDRGALFVVRSVAEPSAVQGANL
jgi:hypothetical protein